MALDLEDEADDEHKRSDRMIVQSGEKAKGILYQ